MSVGKRIVILTKRSNPTNNMVFVIITIGELAHAQLAAAGEMD
jgi:hypothetical protein